MISVDTNILVRFLTADEPDQARRAKQVLTSTEALYITRTVLLETEWVLRYTYGLDRPSVNRSLLKILGLPNVHTESPEVVSLALMWHEQGTDLADALHLAASASFRVFMSFDRDLKRRAGTLEGSVAVEEPPGGNVRRARSVDPE